MTEVTSRAWDEFLTQFPQAHILQTSQWGALKRDFGWSATQVIVGDTGTQILFRQLPLGLSLAYIPKGPLGAQWDDLWPAVDKICRQRKAVFLKIEVDQWDGEPIGLPPQFQASSHEIQPRRTLVVDLTGSEDQVLGQMKQKTRYNIRLAQKRGIVVRQSSDVDAFHRLMVVTGERDTFGVHNRAYYQRAFELFAPQDACTLLCAEYDGQPVAGVMVFARGERAWYFYGASSDQERNRMPTYLLQWEAMRWARSRGCTQYDLWGVPDNDQETLEKNFTERNDGLWGVYRFKRGFGGQLKRAAASWDRVYSSLLYKAYRWWVNRRSAHLE